MKKFLLSICISVIFSVQLLLAQEEVNTVNRYYDRSSISYILVSHKGDRYDNLTKVAFETYINTITKYDLNDIPVKYVSGSIVNRGGTFTTSDADDVMKYLESADVDNQILDAWFPKLSSGARSLEVLHNRGLYNADVEAENIASVIATSLKDTGENLIRNSYVVVIDICNVDPYEISGSRYYTGTIYATLYRLNVNDDILLQLQNSVAVEGDPQYTINAKNNSFDQINVGLKRVLLTSEFVDSDSGVGKAQLVLQTLSGEENSAVYRGNGHDEYMHFVDLAMDRIHKKLELLNEAFKTKSPITSTSPVRSQIGVKEGLRRGAGFEVFRYEGEDANFKKVGFVRASKVAKNLKDNELESSFMSVALRSTIHQGDLLIKAKNRRRSFTASCGMASLNSAAYYYDDYETIDGGLMFDLGYEYEYYNNTWLGLPLLLDFNVLSYGNLAMTLGVGVGATINFFTPNVKLQGYGIFRLGCDTGADVDIYVDSTGDPSINFLNSVSMGAGARLIFNIGYPSQLFAGYEGSVGGSAGGFSGSAGVINFGYRYSF